MVHLMKIKLMMFTSNNLDRASQIRLPVRKPKGSTRKDMSLTRSLFQISVRIGLIDPSSKLSEDQEA